MGPGINGRSLENVQVYTIQILVNNMGLSAGKRCYVSRRTFFGIERCTICCTALILLNWA
jgi:hypothetical protein